MEHNKDNKDLMLKQSYYYDLPQQLIAQFPIEPRDNSRLLIYDRKMIQFPTNILKILLSI